MIFTKDQERLYKSSNSTWNTKRYNSTACVGIITEFAREHRKEYSTANGLMEAYFRSGEQRIALIKEMGLDVDFYDDPVNMILNNESNKQIKDINAKYGRTEDYIYALATSFAKDIKTDIKTGLAFVKRRLFEETFKGVIAEDTLIKTLEEEHIPYNWSIRKTTGEEDVKYSIDFLILDDKDNIRYGIQLKPHTYFLALNKAKKAKKEGKGDVFKYNEDENIKNNDLFEKETGASVHYVMYMNRSEDDDRPLYVVDHRLDKELSLARK